MDIVDILNQILTAVYGKDVRQAIHDGIQQCYEDGKAGVNDLAARRLIEAVAEKNDLQDISIEGLLARVADLENESEGESSSDTTTTEVPTVILDFGYEQFSNVSYNTTVQKAITFAQTFTEAPAVFAAVTFRSAANPQYAQIVAAPINSSITTTGFNLVVGNRTSSGNNVSPTVLWVAFQPTTVEINTEITVPSSDSLTQQQIQDLIGLLD